MLRVSVVIPTYNRADLVVETIQSVQAQTIQDIEILVIDDASTDNTVEVVSQLAADDPRIKLICQPENREVNVARNLGVVHAKGEFVNFLDSDDLFAPDKLEKQLAVFDCHPELDMVVCQAVVFTETPEDAEFVWNRLPDGMPDYRTVLTQLLSNEIGWDLISPLWRRTFLQSLDPMPEEIKIADDRELQIRSMCHAPRIAFVPEALGYSRLNYDLSKRSIFHREDQLPGRLAVHIKNWQSVRRTGLDTAQNRQHLASHFLGVMRPLASARLTFTALRAWGYAFKVSPEMVSRIRLVVFVLPVLLLNLASGRGAGLLKKIVRKFQLELPVNHFMVYRYSAPERNTADQLSTP